MSVGRNMEFQIDMVMLWLFELFMATKSKFTCVAQPSYVINDESEYEKLIELLPEYRKKLYSVKMSK